MDDALDVMAHIGRVMSAHSPQSDVARISRAAPGEVLTLDSHTVAVLGCALHWYRASGGAFDPCRAAQHLAHKGLRPGLSNRGLGLPHALNQLQMLSSNQIRVPQPLGLDLGGIAKGYAVDQAIAALQARGVTCARVNAGGDLRAIGTRPWPIDVRHAKGSLRDRQLRVLRHCIEGAVATSVAGVHNPEFVPTLRRARRTRVWQSATVLAHDCMTADVLTKWALQSSQLCPSLTSTLRQQGARMWRSQ
jgi:thiamine biosynthesis lipoprotein